MKKYYNTDDDDVDYNDVSTPTATPTATPTNTFTHDDIAALGIILLKRQLKNPNSLVIKTITKGERYFDSGSETLTVFFVEYSAMNGYGGYNVSYDQIVVRNGNPSDSTGGDYIYSQLFYCLTHPKLTNQFLTDGEWKSPFPSDLINKTSLNVNTVSNLVIQYETEGYYTITS